MKNQIKQGALIVGAIGLIGAGILSCSTNPDGVSQRPPAAEATSAPKATITYQVVRRWEIPNGGFGELIVVDPNNRNEKDMSVIGNGLKRDMAKERNAFISIYDDMEAVRLRLSPGFASMAEADLAFYYVHYIGEYTKNANTGYHVLEIRLQGMGGPVTTIKY